MNGTCHVARACWCCATTAQQVGEFEGGHPLVRCDGCSVLALHPQPTDTQLAAAYTSEYYGSSRRKFIAPVAAIVGLFQGSRARLVSKRIPEGGSILDVGCGNGGFLLQMQRRGFHVAGTEWTGESAARVPKEANIPVHVGDLIDIPLSQQSFDAITLWHVFEHLRRPRETLAKIRSLLKPGGSLVMSMPNAESPQAQRYGTHWLHHDPPRHLFGFGPHSITLLLDTAGFRVVGDISTWSLEQNPFGEIQSELNRMQAMKHWPGGRDRLYRQLKGLSKERFLTRTGDLARMVMLAPQAVVRDIIESSRGEGATMTVIAAIP